MEELVFNSENIYLLFDLDNDGSSDVLEIESGSEGQANAISWTNSENAFTKTAETVNFTNFNLNDTFLILDANNDGLNDLVQIWKGQDNTANATTYLADEFGLFGRFGNFTYNWDFGDFEPGRDYIGTDFNNDGLVDIVHRNDTASVWTVYQGDGLGGFEEGF